MIKRPGGGKWSVPTLARVRVRTGNHLNSRRDYAFDVLNCAGLGIHSPGETRGIQCSNLPFKLRATNRCYRYFIPPAANMPKGGQLCWGPSKGGIVGHPCPMTHAHTYVLKHVKLDVANLLNPEGLPNKHPPRCCYRGSTMGFLATAMLPVPLRCWQH